MIKIKSDRSKRIIALGLIILMLFVPLCSNYGQKKYARADEPEDTSLTFVCDQKHQITSNVNEIGEYKGFNIDTSKNYAVHVPSDDIKVTLNGLAQHSAGETFVQEGSIEDDMNVSGWDALANGGQGGSGGVEIHVKFPVIITYKVQSFYVPYEGTNAEKYEEPPANAVGEATLETGSVYLLYSMPVVESIDINYGELDTSKIKRWTVNSTETVGEDSNTPRYQADNIEETIPQIIDNYTKDDNAKLKAHISEKSKELVYTQQAKYTYTNDNLSAEDCKWKESDSPDIINDEAKTYQNAIMYTNPYDVYNSNDGDDIYIGEIKYGILNSDTSIDDYASIIPEPRGFDEVNKKAQQGYNYGYVLYCNGDTVVKTIACTKEIQIDQEAPTVTLLGFRRRPSDYVAPATATDANDGWENVPMVSDGFMPNFDLYQYRYYITVEDESGVKDVQGNLYHEYDVNHYWYMEHKRDKADTLNFEKGVDNVYYLEIEESNLSQQPNGELYVHVTAIDSMGNSTGESPTALQPSLKQFDKKRSIKASFSIGEEEIAEFPNHTNKKIHVVVQADAPCRIDSLELKNGTDVVEKVNVPSDGGSPITNTDYSRHSYEWDFYLPALPESGNICYENLELTMHTIQDGNDPVKITLGELIHDATLPSVSLDEQPEAKWYQEYKLKGTIVSGHAEIEDDLTSASYTITGTGEDNTVIIELSPWGNQNHKKSFEIDIPESTTTGGTGISFDAADKSGNALDKDGENASLTVWVDKTKPSVESVSVVSTTANNKTAYYSGDPKIQVKMADNLTIDRLEYTILHNDAIIEKTEVIDADIIDPQGTVGHELSVQNEAGIVEDGGYFVRVKAYDKAGNVSEDAVVMFTVDNTKPEFSASIQAGTKGGKHGRADGTDQYYASDVTVAIGAKDDYITENEITITDNGQEISVPTLVNGEGSLTISGDGSHTITISGKDKAGNEGVSKTVTFIIDETKPSVSMRMNGAEYSEARGRINSLTDTTVDFLVYDDHIDYADNNIVVTRRLPGQENEARTYTATSTKSLSFSEDGDYTVSFYAVDQAGNKSDVRTAQFRIDKNAPQLQILGASPNTSNETTVTFVMNETMWQDASGEINIYRKAGDGLEEALYKTVTVRPTGQETRISEVLRETGVYRLEMDARDQLGHTVSLKQSFTLDKHAPVVSATGVRNYDKKSEAVEYYVEINEEFFTTKTVTITGTKTDINGKVEQLSYSDELILQANPTIFRKTFEEDGIYDLTVYAKDLVGNERTDSVHFTIDTEAPVIGDLSEYEDKVLQEFRWDKDLDALVSDLTVCDTHMYLNGREYDGSIDIEDGVYTLRIVSKDELGHESEKTISFTLDTKAPVFIIVGAEDGEIKKEAYSIDVSLQLDEDILKEVQLNGSPVTVTEDNTAHVDVHAEGKYELSMKAVDLAGNESSRTISFVYGEEKKAGVRLWIIVVCTAGGLALTGGFFALLMRKRKL